MDVIYCACSSYAVHLAFIMACFSASSFGPEPRLYHLNDETGSWVLVGGQDTTSHEHVGTELRLSNLDEIFRMLEQHKWTVELVSLASINAIINHSKLTGSGARKMIIYMEDIENFSNLLVMNVQSDIFSLKVHRGVGLLISHVNPEPWIEVAQSFYWI